MEAADSGSTTPIMTRATMRVCAMDGALLGLFMVSACLSVALFEHPNSPLRQRLDSALVRRALLGVVMGVTAAGLIYSPWGKRSGAVMNPAMTLCFLRLGKLEPLAALGYTLAQFAGAALGVALSALLLGSWLAHPAVNYLITAPGASGPVVAWLAELGIGFSMLTLVMMVNRVPRLAPRSGLFAAALLALLITFEAPLSGTSLNPARSFGSALVARCFHDLWIYLTAPVSGMLLGLELQSRLFADRERLCGKLNHSRIRSCFLRCNCLGRRSNQS
jgi:aquaporin Z